jgi:hypothetical protein
LRDRAGTESESECSCDSGHVKFVHDDCYVW